MSWKRQMDLIITSIKGFIPVYWIGILIYICFMSITMIGSPVCRRVASEVQHGVQHGVQRIRFPGSFYQGTEQLCVPAGRCEVQRRSSLKVSAQSRSPVFQQSRCTLLAAQHGLQG